MKKLYTGIINILIFFFVVDLFSSIIIIGSGSFYEKFVYAVIFSVLLLLIPHVLMFFKVGVSELTEFISAAVVSSLFFFLGYYFFGFVNINGFIFDLKVPVINPINLADKSLALLVVGTFAAFLCVGIGYLNKKKKKSLSSY